MNSGDISKYPSHLASDLWSGIIDDVTVKWQAAAQAAVFDLAVAYEVSEEFYKGISEHFATKLAKERGFDRIRILDGSRTDRARDVTMPDSAYITIHATNPESQKSYHRIYLEGIDSWEPDLNNISACAHSEAPDLS